MKVKNPGDDSMVAMAFYDQNGFSECIPTKERRVSVPFMTSFVLSTQSGHFGKS